MDSDDNLMAPISNSTGSANLTSFRDMFGYSSLGTSNNLPSMIFGIQCSCAILFASVFMSFCLRRWFPQIYYPKTYRGRHREKLKLPLHNPWKILKAMFQAPDHLLIRSCGLDAFFFLRYIRFMFGLFLILSVIVIPILAPVNFFGQRYNSVPYVNGTSSRTLSNQKEGEVNSSFRSHHNSAYDLKVISSGNILPEHAKYYWSHFMMGIVVAIVVCYAFFKELEYFVQIRETWLRPNNRLDKCSSATILVTIIPKHRLSVKDLEQYFAGICGGVECVWINRDVRELTSKIKKRTKMIKILEALETKLVMKAERLAKRNNKSKNEPSKQTQTQDAAEEHPIQIQNKEQKTAPQPQGNSPVPEIAEQFQSPDLGSYALETINPCRRNEYNQESNSEKWRVWLKDKDRPTIRISHACSWFVGKFPFCGQRVDAIVHYRNEISRLNGDIEAMRENLLYVNSAFIRFRNRSGAHLALVAPHDPTTMRIVAFESSYDDIIWSNLAQSYYSRKACQLMHIISTSFLILVYGFPTILATFLCQIETTGNDLGWNEVHFSVFNRATREWLKTHRPVSYFVTMICPLLLLMLTRWLIILGLEWLAVKQGAPTQAHVQLMIQNGQFAFLFIQIFLVATFTQTSRETLLRLASEATEKPGGFFAWNSIWAAIPEILANNFQESSIFFVGYLIFQAAWTAGDEIGQLCNGFLAFWQWLSALGKIRTPRQIFREKCYIPECTLGWMFPLMTLYGCIVLAYSITQPAILAVGVLSFGLFWIGSAYGFLYIKRVSGGVNGTNGTIFVRAINQTFLGVYVMEICLVGLFVTAVNRDKIGRDNKKQTETNDGKSQEGHGKILIVQGVLISIVFLMTLGWQWYVNRWLTQVGSGLHSSSDREGENMDLEESLPENVTDTPSHGVEKENVPADQKGKAKEVGNENRSIVRRRLKTESAAGECEINPKVEEKVEGEDDYISNVLRECVYRQPNLWLPNDKFGVGQDEARLCREVGVSAEAVSAGIEIEIWKRKESVIERFINEVPVVVADWGVGMV